MKVIYGVNKASKTVYGTGIVTKDELLAHFSPYPNMIKYVDVLCGGLPNKIVFTSRAVCQDGDEFDVEYGKKLVHAKLALKKHDKVIRMIEKIRSTMSEISKVLPEVAGYHLVKYGNIETDFVDYFGFEDGYE